MMKEEIFQEKKPELVKLISEWLSTNSLLDDSETLTINLTVHWAPRIQILVTSVQELPPITDQDDLCATRIKDLNLPGYTSKYIEPFLTLGQLTRLSEDQIRGRRCPRTFNSIGNVTIQKMKQLLQERGMKFGSNLPIGPRERIAIMQSETATVLHRANYLFFQQYATIADLLSATKEEILESARKHVIPDRKGFDQKEIFEEIVQVLKEFQMELK